ncbi:OmpA family protein [Agaribacterium sp. ZY112]|uniref:OmpA family protein n=1 Tax=Agaribacterium sp. ZY112 TaxID=3233574 RepID=UPI0035235168
MKTTIIFKTMVALPILAFGLSACTSIPDAEVDRYQWDDINDSDKDGVVNARDICAKTPDHSVIDTNGCAEWQPALAHKEFHIDFDFDSSAIRDDQQWKIVRLAAAMERLPSSNLKLIGDTSSEGSLAYNKKLAKRRADSIIQALSAEGIDPSRVQEHVFTDSRNSLFRPLEHRRRRTVGLITYPGSEKIEEAWTIYSAEETTLRK